MGHAISWLLLGTLLCSACGREPADPGSPGRTRRLAWTLTSESPPVSQPSRVARYRVFSEAPDWIMMAGRTEVGRLEEESGELTGVLWLSGPVGPQRALQVIVNGSFDTSEVHRLAATLAFQGQVHVRTELLREGRTIAQGSTSASGSQGEPGSTPLATVVEVRLDPPLETARCDQLLLSIEGSERVGVQTLEFFRDPPDAALPPLGAPAQVEIDGEWRRAAGLASGSAVQTRFHVQHGHALRIDYGLPRSARGPVLPQDLELELSGSGGLVRVYSMPFEYEQVVVYSEHTPGFLRERAQRTKLRRIKSAGARENMRRQMDRMAAQRSLNDAVFGEQVEPKAPKIDPASIPQGLINGWIARTIDLEEFVGQEVVARLELIGATDESVLCAVAEPTLLGTALEKPLVLLITSDAHRADHLTAGGMKGVIETPWIDILARRGTVFSQAWSSTNSPRAAHLALFEGQAPRLALDDSPRGATLPQRFAEAGWLTVAIAAGADLRPDVSTLTRDFEQVIAPTADEFSADEGIDTLVELLPELQDQATFVWLQLRDALAPYDPPAEFRREHYPKDQDPAKGQKRLSDEERARIPAWTKGIADLGYVQALYSSEITWIDRRLRPLVEHPRLARAVVAFAGTCGESLTSFDHSALSAETLRVPLLVCGPGLTGTAIEMPVEVHDLGRTLLDLANLETSAFPGQALLPRPDAPPDEPATHFALAGDRKAAVAVQDGFLLAAGLGPGGELLSGETLHALELDPACELDVSADEPQRTAELHARLAAWLAGEVDAQGAAARPPP